MQKNRAFVITNPMIAANRSSEVTLSKFLRVITPCFSSLMVIGGNLSVEKDLEKVCLRSFPIHRSPNKLKRVLDVVGLQVKMAFSVLRRVKQKEPVFFWIADKMILPYLAAKIKRAEINYFIYGNVAKEGRGGRFTRISSKLIRYMAEHADHTCMESPSVQQEWPGLKVRNRRVIHLYTENIRLNSLKDRENVVGMVCRLAPGKHVLESIRGFADVHKSHPEWCLEIIGSGKQEDECRALIEELDAQDYVLLHGWVEHAEMTDVTRRWKYLLFPTDTEGMPNGLIEMMGQGIPALASPVGGIADVVEPGKNGWYLQDCSEVSIRTGIEKAITSDGYGSLAENAHSTIRGSFDLCAARRLAETIFTEK